MEIQGKIIKKLPIQEGTGSSGKQWRKQDFVIETEGQYPKKVAITAMNDNIEKVPVEGTNVTVSVNIESREHNGKWYTNVNMWKI